ncbi:MAG: iron complex outermembrane receptor protein [Marinoscillum sp.]
MSTGFTAGAFETYRSSATLAHNNDKLSFRVSYSLLESAGYRQNNETKREQIGASLSYKISQKHTLSLLAVGTKLFARIPSAINETDFNNNPKKAAANWALIKGYEDYDRFILGLTHKVQMGEKTNLSTTLFVNTKESYEPRPFNTLTENTNAIGIRSVYTSNWKNVATTIGYEAFHDRNDWKIYEHTYDSDGQLTNADVIPLQYEEQRTYINAFTDNTITLSEKASLTVGLNVNDTWYQFTDGTNPSSNTQSDYSFGVIISPKIGGTYKLNSSQTLFTNISHGFSPPSLEETLYPDGQINPNIKPESGWNFESGLRGNSKHFNYNLTAYYMLIRDLLVAQRTAEDTYVGVNAGRNNHFGVEASGNYFITLSPNYFLNIFGAVNYSDFRFGRFENEGVNYDGNALTGVAKWNGNIGIELISTSGFYGNITSRYMDKIPMNDANTKYTQAYFILDTKVGYRLEVGRLLFDGYLGLNNLTDTHYASMILINATGFGAALPRYYYPGNPRNLFAGVQLKVRLGK